MSFSTPASPKNEPAASFRDDLFIIEKTRLIGCKEFHDCLKIPQGVRIIGKAAFKNHTHIRKVILPDTLKTIQEDAFFNCAQLDEIVLPQGLKAIKKGAFHHCRSLKTLRLPASLTELDEEAFLWCDELSEVVFEEGCSLEMKDPPFQKHPKLRLISIPASVKILNQDSLGYQKSTVIECYAGSDAYFTARLLDIPYLLTDGKEYDSADDFVMENRTVVRYIGTHPLAVIPEGTAAVGHDAFRGLEQVTCVFFPDSVTDIGEGTFADCSNLFLVRLPRHLKCIPKDAFYRCDQLISINFPQGLTSIESGAFFDTSLREARLPGGLERIGARAFGNCPFLRDIHIPASVSLLDEAVSGSEFVTIVAPEGSKASRYARERGIPLHSVAPPVPPRAEDLPGNIRRTFYETLEPCKKLIYHALVTALLQMEDSCKVAGFTPDSLDVLGVVWAVACDYPEIFWVNWQRLQYFGYDLFVPGKLGSVYSVTKKQREEIQSEIDHLVTPFLASLPRNLGEYERAKRAYVWVANQLEYDYEGLKQESKNRYHSITHDDLRNIYGAFVKKKAVCAGYARALQYILQKMGIECVEYRGVAKTQDAHAWVCARLEGDFYHLDVTWADASCLDYRYFCLTDDEMYKHQHQFLFLANEIRCNATRCSYYAKEGLYFHRVDEEEILEGIRGFLSRHPGNPVSVKFANLLLLHRAYACLKDSKKLRDLVRETGLMEPTVLPDEGNLLLDIRF